MMIPLLVGLLTAASVAPPAALEASMRIEIARVATPGGSEAGPYAALGPIVAQMLTPDGAVDMDWYGSAGGVRATLHERLSMLPAGAVVVQRAGAAAIQVMNPAARTYFDLPAAAAADGGSGVPDVVLQPTGEFATIAGARAERHTVTLTLALPPARGVPAWSGLPANLTIVGDIWLTDAFAGAQYASILKTLDALMAIPGLSRTVPAGAFPMKTRLRLTLLPGYELRSEITRLAAAAVDPRALDVPAEFHRVAPPGQGAGGTR
ncbi:MAG TPA: hypothetical protein VFX12_15005 [Vicinamibacterales bacterium]|nr:hypothetical protein [Vicinamibacterales bacterium]